MAATPNQRREFARAFIAWAEQVRRLMDQGTVLSNQFNDLGIGAALTDADLNAISESAGVLAADVNAALGIAGTMVSEFTAARRAAFNKIGHGAP